MILGSLIPKKIPWRDVLTYLISLGLGIGLLVYTFRGVSLLELRKELINIRYQYLILFILIIFLGTFLRALRWKYMLITFKNEIKIVNLLNATIFGYGVNVILPRAGEIARALYIGAKEGISRSSSLGTIIVERVIDLIFLLFSVLISIMAFGKKLEGEYPWIYQSFYWGILILILSFVLLYLVIKYQNEFLLTIEKFFKRYSFSFMNKASEITSKIIDGFGSIKTIRNYFFIFIFSLLLWFTYAFGSYIGLLMLRMDKIQNVNLFSGIMIMSITTFGIMIPIPGSTGSYHAFCKSVLTMILGFSVQISLVYATLTHLLNTIPFLVITIILILRQGMSKIIKN